MGNLVDLGLLYQFSLTAALIIMLLANFMVNTSESYKIALDGCPDKCGNVSIPYPFGIGEGCSYADHFNISCNHTLSPPKPIYGVNMEVLNISLHSGQLRLADYVARICYNKDGTLCHQNIPWARSPVLTVSETENLFVATGCDTFARFEGTRLNGTKNYSTGCMTSCNSIQEVDNGTCSGVGCCLMTSIPKGINSINIRAGSYSNYTSVSGDDMVRCSSAFVVARDSFYFTTAYLTAYNASNQTLPAVYDWAVGTHNCSTAQANRRCLCKQNSECLSMPVGRGYRCRCSPGFEGNPYLPDGCQDINECDDPKKNQCVEMAHCINTIGNYTCRCPKGYHGSGRAEDRCVIIVPTAVKVTAGVGGGIIVVMAMALWLYWQHEKKQLIKARETCFKQNGGQILLQKLSQRDMSVDMLKILTIDEVKNATNSFSDTNVIGQGGFGKVYKGVLADNQVVAIKKSLKLNTNESEQFINEVIVLSRLSNRHVVKLLGCCLDSEVPLLVYEFVPNGTLHEHLHDERKASILTWDIRLRIALEVAEVISYLHTSAEVTIIHRDVKSTNILLDQSYSAKVSDFGASRLVPIDQDHLPTMVLGTRGYLDPEYMQTSELTQKSDVYSFGVVLLEILTGEEAFSYRRLESEIYLSNYFLKKLKEDFLLEIVDVNIGRDEATIEQVKEVADLARRCLKLKGDDRPTMKGVAMELLQIRRTTEHHPRSDSVAVLEEESKYLRGETKHVHYDGHSEGRMVDSSSSQSAVLELSSLKDGR